MNDYPIDLATCLSELRGEVGVLIHDPSSSWDWPFYLISRKEDGDDAK